MKIPDVATTGPLAPLSTWARAVRAALSNGWTVADQASGELKTVRWSGSELLVRTSLARAPLFVSAVAARPVGVGAELVQSGSVVAWSWADGSVRVMAIEGLTAPDVYDVTFWIQGG